KLEHRDGNDIAGLKPYDYSNVFQSQDPTNDGFVDLGSGQRWYQADSRQYSFRFDYNGQIHPLHFLKTGFEFYYEEISSTEILRPTVSLTDSNGNEIYPPFPDYLGRNRGLYPGYGEYRWVLDNYPNRGALYVQDNIEFSGLNLHVGIRYDYYDLGRQVYYDDFIDAWLSAVNPSGTTEEARLTAEWVEAQGKDENGVLNSGRFLSDQKRFLYYLTHGNFSPRLAIGYPVTDKIVFYFNYGHFLQYPDRDAYYRDPFVYQQNNSVGNPDLKPQRTVAYEAGFEDQFTDDMAFSVRAFYKDIFDYATSVARGGIYLTRNLDYSSARGFEVTLNQSFTGNLSTTLSYSYQIAKGRSSNSTAAIFSPQYQLPRETRLNWDQQHTANVFVTYRVGPRDEGEFFGLPFINNYGISVTWSFGSGFPYTPVITSRNNVQDQYLNNSETRPYTSLVNLSLYKGLLLFDKINTTITLDITNLFNRRNVGTGDPNAGFNNQEGRPYEYGDYDPQTLVIYSYNRFGARVPPYVFDAPRQVLLGLRLSWE
ncbi:MAG: TonB-dependent receptor, partial [Bacteroidetes bacterium]